MHRMHRTCTCRLAPVITQSHIMICGNFDRALTLKAMDHNLYKEEYLEETLKTNFDSRRGYESIGQDLGRYI